MTSDYRVSPQRSSSTIVSRLLRDLFRSSPATTPRESSTSSACVASIVNELSGNQARSAVADPTPPSHLRAPDFSGPPTSDVYSQSIGLIRLCSSCSSSCTTTERTGGPPVPKRRFHVQWVHIGMQGGGVCIRKISGFVKVTSGSSPT